MPSLDTSVQFLPKVGPKYKSLLEKLGIYTISDLLYYFPYRYDDFSQLADISKLQIGDTCTIKGVLGPVENIFTRNGKRLTKSDLTDITGKVALIWFNQHYLKNSLKQGAVYYASGTVTSFSSKAVIISPELELLKQEDSINTGRLVPVYSETAGISSKWIRSRINDILTLVSSTKNDLELFPKEFLDRYDLTPVNEALNQIHFPASQMAATMARKRFAFEEMVIELIRVQERKAVWESGKNGAIIRKGSLDMNAFEALFPFNLTPSQKKTILDIESDLMKTTPMNRLLQGDVGSGKTVVAIAAALMAVNSGFKVLYLAPTEILANQHYKTFCQVLKPLNVHIGRLTGSSRETSADTQIIIGTHALLFQKSYENIGLIIIDEQQRFGVEQRGKLVEMSKQGQTPNLLSLTATPIPRTLALTLYGDLELSVIHPSEEKIRNVKTTIVPESKRPEIYAWIASQTAPAFIVCPLIDPSESDALENVKSAQTEYGQLSSFYGPDRVGLLHGKLKPSEKQAVIDRFSSGQLKILVSTPVIEVGIDIPDATIMIIESGERYGLASLHQLRGRIGRNGQQAACFIFMSKFTRPGYDRLKNLENENSGQKLAEIDLRIRGEGDIFSTLQHGYKKFKLATFEDLGMLEKAKEAATELHKTIELNPQLNTRVGKLESNFIRNN